MNEHATSPVRRRASEAGFSLLEGLIAAGILLFVLIGILPLFERARLNLLQGNDATNITNAGIDGLDQMLALPFNSFLTNVPATTSQGVTTDVWAQYADRWYADITQSPVPNDQAQYTRTVTVEQFSTDALNNDGVLCDGTGACGADERLPSGANGTHEQGHIKRYTLDITNTRTPGLNYRLIVLQSN